jgi:4a-hydroxytetrahydrobiopterin dehydratase
VDPTNLKRLHDVGWRVLAYAACTHVRTTSLGEAVALAEAIGTLAEAPTLDPDLDVRSRGVTVRLRLSETGELGEAELALAEAISAAAGGLSLRVEPPGVQSYQIAIDALDIPTVMPFWAAVLGYEHVMDVVADRRFEGPTFWFQQMDAPRPQRNRIHIDLYLPEDQARARIDAAVAAGGSIVSDSHAPWWWTLADPEGNEVDVAPWPDMDQDADEA